MKKFFAFAAVMIFLTGSFASARVIGRVNGYPITEKSANAFLKVVTKGKLKYRQLRPKDKRDVVKRLSVDALVVGMAKHNISEQERNQIIVNYWLARKTRKMKVDPAEVKKAYTSNRKFFKGPDGKVLPFEKVKDMVAVSLKQKKYVAELMKKAKITMGKKVIKSGKSTSIKNSKGIYIVKSGNTLSGIAHKYHITMDQLRTLNHMSKKDVLKVGQKLKVPGQ